MKQHHNAPEPLQIICGCVLSVLPTLDEGSVHCCTTSPPYFGLRDYGIEPSDWPAVQYAPMAGLPAVDVEAWTGCLGHEPTISAYVGHLVHVFRLVKRVMRDDGTLWCNLGDSFANDGKWGGSTGGKHVGALHGNGSVGRLKRKTGLKAKDLIGIPWRVALALQADGWWLRSEIIWAKGLSFCDTYAGSVMPDSVRDRVTRSHEQVFMLTKKARYYFDAEAVKEKTTGNAHSRGNGLHPKVAPAGSGIKQNESFSVAITHPVSTRNLRSVWAINPEASSRKHYAGWPSRLVAPMIKAGTSERGVCGACLSPYERMVEKGEYDKTATQGQQAWPTGSGGNHNDSHGGFSRRDTKTTGWRATCDCPPADPVPATVLDPFAGTGTTARVARRLGRHAAIVDRSGDYVEMAQESLAQHELF